MALKDEVTELRSACEQHKHQIVSARAQLRVKDEEIEQRQCDATSYYNTLEVSTI